MIINEQLTGKNQEETGRGLIWQCH